MEGYGALCEENEYYHKTVRPIKEVFEGKPYLERMLKEKNNGIKTVKRKAYGYRNMDNFWLRILVDNSKGAGS